ncbi:MAG: AMP-binding protein [Clostridiales bacterium]|nr:AMP-binding protein [Clostridiales bacterium]
MLERFVERIDFDSYEDFKRNFRLKIPEDFNFGFDVVDVYADEEPDREALIWCDDDGNEKHFTFADVKEQSNRAANMFKALGVKKGDTVMIILRQRPEVWFVMVGLHKLGAVVIPATFLLTKHDIVYRCNAADVRMICCADDPVVVEHVNQARGECDTLEYCSVIGDAPEGWRSLTADMSAASPVFDRPTGDEATHNDDKMLIYFSSGTSGEPKMILHDYLLPLGHIVTAKYWQQVYDGCRHLTQADSGWAKFAWGKIYGQWICGAVIVTYDTVKFNPHRMLEIMEKLKLNSFCGPSTIYRYLIQEDLTKYDFSSIKHCSMAGEPLNPEVYYKWQQQTGLEIREGFGQSEGSVLFANFPWLEVRPGSTGMPTPLYDIDIVDDSGKSCEEGIVGSVVIKNLDKKYPTGLFREYYRNPEANEASFSDGVYNTGDTAWRDADGYIWFVGRNDDVIKCSGYRIGPFEVESALMTHPSVLECAVTAVPDPMRGQVVKATIVLTRNYSPSPELVKELQTHVKQATAPYKYPRVIEFVTELPKTTSGKIMRTAIRKADMQKYAAMNQKS